MTATLAERPAGLLDCEAPRIWTPPLRPLTPKTTKGYEVIAFAEEVLGINLHPWQRWALIHGLEILDDGTFRFRTLLVLVGRQNGKTTLMLVIALWRMYVDRAPLVIGTAQNLDVAEEAWQAAVDMAQGVPELAEEIAHVDLTNGKKALRLETGERYKVAAASRRGGRGLSGDLVLLDELREHRTWEAWGAVSKTTMARALAQILGFSTAGDRGSVVLNTLRRKALEVIANVLGRAVDGVKPGAASGAEDDAPGLFDYSAEPGCALDDRAGWAQSNPSMGHPGGITERAIRSALGTDPESVFRTEVLCQHVDDMETLSAIAETWSTRLDPKMVRPSPPQWGLAVSTDRAWATIDSSDGSRVEVAANRQGTGWVVAECQRLTNTHGGVIALNPSSPAGSLLKALTDAGVPTREVGGAEWAQACGNFHDAVMQARISHRGDPELDLAVRKAVTRPSGESWVWSQRLSPVDIGPLCAAALAFHASGSGREPSFAFA